MTAKRGLFWYVDGELICFPLSGEEVDTVSYNHKRFWETLPHLPLTLIAILPFPGYNADVTEDSYRQIIAESDHILYVEAIRQMSALAVRDQYMVDHSSRLIAVYDERSRIHSGTWRALCYVREKKLDIRQIRWMKYL